MKDKFPRDEGIGPLKELIWRSSTFRCLSCPIDSGIFPVRWFSPNSRISNFWKFELPCGISPFSELLPRSSCKRVALILEINQLGISWLKRFPERSRTRRDVKLTNPRDGFGLSSWQYCKSSSERDGSLLIIWSQSGAAWRSTKDMSRCFMEERLDIQWRLST